MIAKKISVSTPCSDYLAMVGDVELVNSLMGGTKVMRAAGEKYLPREPKESLKAYQNRLARSVLYNAFADTIYKLVGKPFSKPVTVKHETPDKIKTWAEDIDRCGCNITTFAREVLEAGLTDGITHILVDYPEAPENRSL
jgi:hypothetical protein